MKSPIPSEALHQHTIVLGKTGSGKSSVLRLLVENQLTQQQPVCIVDPKGDWWGIKSSADGKHAGFPLVIFGGEHADVPINAHAGAQVAELYATGNRPCLIDLGGWMPGDRTRFFIDFASTLFRLTRGARWLVIDEVHNFAPQGKVMDPDAGKMLHWANRIITEGRGKGVTVLSASQRPQKVHKDFVTSNETLIAMRVIHELDRLAMKAWIDGCGDPEKGREVLGSLAQMKRGEGWVWSPEIGFGPKRVTFPLFETYDSFAPQATEADRHPKGWAEVDLDDVRTKLASAIEQAEQDDPKLLRKKIAELEQQARTAAPRELAVDVEALDRERRRGWEDGHAAAVKSLRPAIDRMSTLRTALDEQLGGLLQDLERWPWNVIEPSPVARNAATKPLKEPEIVKQTERTPVARQPAAKPDGGALAPAERAFLTVLAQQNRALTRNQIAIFAGYSAKSGHIDNTLGSLRTKRYVEGGRAAVTITSQGIAVLGRYEKLPTGRALQDYWCGVLDPAASKFLRVICDAYPKSLTRDEIAERAGYSVASGHVDNTLGQLRSRELVSGGRAAIKASEDLL